ncbi:hypothetical protein B7P43_G00749 [Cryptotermes secundus]|uniref:Cytochrome b5 heme-binding domain-containing protein n=1 Tax=Cryptotermes secundus TaxID=105785 RepID=A0A2J7Q7R9_9NEOP|nr:hypothetical protein B7P43_G00749 [Cryptotermes secundus]
MGNGDFCGFTPRLYNEDLTQLRKLELSRVGSCSRELRESTVEEYEFHTPADTRVDIMLSPLATGDDTSAALAVVKATVGQKHPGGEEILLEYAGRDATLAFRGIGHGVELLQVLERRFLGVLPESERIYHTLGGKLAGFRPS